MQSIIHQKNLLAKYIIITLLFISKVEEIAFSLYSEHYLHQLPSLDPPLQKPPFTQSHLKNEDYLSSPANLHTIS